MFVPLWLIVATLALIFFLVLKGFQSPSGNRIAGQRRDALPHVTFSGTREDEARVMSLPQVRDAMARNRKIEAIKEVRLATGLGLKEAKELVERNSPGGQRRDALPHAAFSGTREDEARVMSLPQVRDAMARNRKIEAIKEVRLATGLGLREAKELVERNSF